MDTEALRYFLKQSALEPAWSSAFVAKTLGLDAATAEQLELAGYSEPVPKKRDTWRNTEAGNKVAGARPPRLTRKTAEELLTDVADRASASPEGIEKIVAFGAINSE